MATYNAAAVTDGVIAYQKPITLQQGRALRDNGVARGQGDPTVPADELPTVLLGTLTTTTGSTHTLSSLILTPYKMLICTINGVSTAATSVPLRLDGIFVSEGLSSAPDAWFGFVVVDLSNGVAGSMVSSSITSPMGGGVTGYSTASTSISFSIASSAFDAGSITVWGVK